MANGIFWAGLSINKGSSLKDISLEEWYSATHIRDLLSTGKIDFAVRFKNLDASRQYKYMTAYNVLDITSLHSDEILVGNSLETTPVIDIGRFVANGCLNRDLLLSIQFPVTMMSQPSLVLI